MIKRNIKETVTEYDENGKVVKVTVTETKEEDGNYYGYPYFGVDVANNSKYVFPEALRGEEHPV